jgi:hypothetical protein
VPSQNNNTTINNIGNINNYNSFHLSFVGGSHHVSNAPSITGQSSGKEEPPQMNSTKNFRNINKLQESFEGQNKGAITTREQRQIIPTEIKDVIQIF